MRTDLVALLVLLVASVAGAWISAERHTAQVIAVQAATLVDVETIIDEGGNIVACRDYQRIVCSSSIAATVVPELVNTNRIVMVTQWWSDNSNLKFRLDHAPIINKTHGIESILAQNPDLVIVNSLHLKKERLARLRETGIQVLDLGKMLGWETFSKNILMLGDVLKQPDRAHALLNRVQRRLQHTAIHIPQDQRRSAMWLSLGGGKMYGGTIGSSYHDMLRFAGLNDVVEGTVDYAWPNFTMEELLRYDPDYIVTGDAESAKNMRALPGIKDMRSSP